MSRAVLFAMALGAAGLSAPSAMASLTRAELDGVGVAAPAGTLVPRQLMFQELDGGQIRLGTLLGARPALLVLADYACRELCGPILSIVSGTLDKTGLVPGRDYDLIVVGLNPEASRAEAAAMKASQMDGAGALSRVAQVLTGTAETIGGLEAALRYRAVYDADDHRFAHPSTVFVLTPGGTLSRLLPGLAMDGASLRLALVEAGEGRVGTFADQVHLFCYGLDPAIGKATRSVQFVLIGGGLLTLGSLALWLARARPRSGAAQQGGPA